MSDQARRKPKHLVRKIAIGVGVLLLVGLVALLFPVLWILNNPVVNTSRAFLEAALQGRAEANQYLTEETRAAVSRLCPDGQAANCIAPLVNESWGDLEGIVNDYGTGDHALLFGTFWSNLPSRAVAVVLEMKEVDGAWRVGKWRGFIILEPNEAVRLLRGQRLDNAFPPATE